VSRPPSGSLESRMATPLITPATSTQASSLIAPLRELFRQSVFTRHLQELSDTGPGGVLRQGLEPDSLVIYGEFLYFRCVLDQPPASPSADVGDQAALHGDETERAIEPQVRPGRLWQQAYRHVGQFPKFKQVAELGEHHPAPTDLGRYGVLVHQHPNVGRG